MLKIYGEKSLDACQALWEQFVPRSLFTDLWGVRLCFHKRFQREPFFVVAEEDGRTAGLMPLSWIPETESYGYFPGETWHHKTWLEQNRFMAKNPQILEAMIQWLKSHEAPFHLRYLLPVESPLAEVDEIGYLFDPREADYDIEKYYQKFSRKSLKGLLRDVDKFYAQGLMFREDAPGDFDLMVQMNQDRFGEDSYFSDARFSASFRELAEFLSTRGLLKMTAILIGKDVAAVDMGCVYNNVYTLLGGGTNPRYPGIAKVINLHHLKVSCREQYFRVDFLCGDFSWKKLFHLTPRPLYVIANLEQEDYGEPG